MVLELCLGSLIIKAAEGYIRYGIMKITSLNFDNIDRFN